MRLAELTWSLPSALAEEDWQEDGEPTIGHDLRHDPWLMCSGDLLAIVAGEVFALLETTGRDSGRKPRADAVERRRMIVNNLIANLTACALQREPGRRIAISTKHARLTRYDRPGFPPRLVRSIIEAMEASELVQRTAGTWRGLLTAIEPTQAFRERLDNCGCRLSDISRMPGGETIILKASSTVHNGPKPLVDYAETAETRRLRAEMAMINAFLNQADISIDGEPQVPFLLTRQFQISSPTAPQRFDRHGRIYDGFWINMHRTERHRLRIGGEELADLDFTGMFTQLAYLEAGLPLPERDPYGGIEGLEGEGTRDAIKQCLNALYFRSGPMLRLPSEAKALLGLDWTAERLVAAIAKRHAPIGHLFATGLGLKLMHTESRVLVRTLLDLISLGVPALPVHDGIMVPVSTRDIALGAMRRGSRAVLGVELPVKEKVLPKPPSSVGQ